MFYLALLESHGHDGHNGACIGGHTGRSAVAWSWCLVSDVDVGPASIVEVAAVVVEDGEINSVGGIVSFTTDVVGVVRVNPRQQQFLSVLKVRNDDEVDEIHDVLLVFSGLRTTGCLVHQG